MTTQPETDKYYVPEIEEFHTGFEFELWDYGYQTFMPKKFTFEYCNAIAFATSHFSAGEGVPEKTIRVRYLSHEDIVGEGWAYHSDKYSHAFNSDHNLCDAILYHNEVDNTVNIYLGIQTMFSGTIRNRSELKMIMKMLGIK